MSFKQIKECTCLLMVFGLAFLFAGGNASADEAVTYSYTGNDFNQFTVYAPGSYSMCPERCSIRGSFTMSPPLVYPADADFYGLDPNTYNFTDGAVTFTPENSSIRVFEVGVNASGAIDVWNIVLDHILPSGQCEQLNTGGLNDVFDGSTIYGDSNCSGLTAPGILEASQVSADQGTWKSVGIELPPCGVTLPGGISGGPCPPGGGSGSGSGSGGSGNGGGTSGVPEPGSLTLVVGGLLGGVFLSRLRRS